jgi:hypothetical protein
MNGLTVNDDIPKNLPVVCVTDYNQAARGYSERSSRLNNVDGYTSVAGLDLFYQILIENAEESENHVGDM